jgi:hypothetical protein
MAEPASTPSPDDSTASSSRLGTVGVVASIILVVVYIAFVALQWFGGDASDVVWARRLALLTGLEALAFSGAGALLGSSVQRRATRAAETRADRAEQAADANARDAEKGRALQNAIAARITRAADRPDDIVRGAVPADRALIELDALAKRYDGM